MKIIADFNARAKVVVHHGDSLEFLRTLPADSVQLIISSPPYNVGKEYEVRTELEHYLEGQQPVLAELARVLKPGGSLCWQVGNYIEKGEVFPLDIYYYPLFKDMGLTLRNRVIWHFGHGLHASRRLSGRYETILWFTKGEGYTFNLDPIRVPSKYPGKRHYKGDKKGTPSGNPLGKNPSDFWEFLREEWKGAVWDVPNVKANHPEKTTHPCQFPIELVERCVLAFTDESDWVLDPYMGVGSTLVAALKNGRCGVGVDRVAEYVSIARRRITDLDAGVLRTRSIGTPVYKPSGKERASQVPDEWKQSDVT